MNAALIFFGSKFGLVYGERVVTRISYQIHPNIFWVWISTTWASQTKICSNQFLPRVLLWLVISIALSFNVAVQSITLSFNVSQDRTSTPVSDSACSNMIQPSALINDQRLIMTGVLRLHCSRVDIMAFCYGFSDELVAGLHCLLIVTRRRSS